MIPAANYPLNCGTPAASFTRQHAKRQIAAAGFTITRDQIARTLTPETTNRVTVRDCVIDRVVSAAVAKDYLLRFASSDFGVFCASAVSSNAAIASVALDPRGAFATYQSGGEAAVTITSNEGESQVVPLTFSSVPATTVETFVRWADGSLGKHITDSTYAKLAGKTPPPLIPVQILGLFGRPTAGLWRWGSPINTWSVAPMSAATAGSVINTGNNNPAGPWIRDPSFFLADVDLTCISVWNTGTNGIVRGTLVTPEHFVSCAHGWQPGVGDTLYFAERSAASGQSETVHSRTVTHTQRITSRDITVGRLSSPLPSSIKPAVVMPKTASSKIKGHEKVSITTFGGGQNMLPVICFNQDFQALLHGAWTFGAHNLYEFPPEYLPFTNGIRFLDSGNPTFCLVNNEAVLLSTHTSSTIGAAVSLPTNYDAIEATMAAQGGATTTLTPVDLSGFPSYT